MEIILETKNQPTLQFYWLEKNRTFILQKHEFISRESDGKQVFVYTFNNIYDGTYDIQLSSGGIIPSATFITRDKTSISTKTQRITAFKIQNKHISILQTESYLKTKQRNKIGISVSATKSWNIYWEYLHYFSYCYPEIPSEDDIDEVIKLTNVMKTSGIPCPICTRHFNDFIRGKNIKVIASSRESLVSFYFELHNDVNKRNNKTLYTTQALDKKYSAFGSHYNDIVTKYKTDIIQLFNKRRLQEFPSFITQRVKPILWKSYNVFESKWIQDASNLVLNEL